MFTPIPRTNNFVKFVMYISFPSLLENEYQRNALSDLTPTTIKT